MVCHKRMWASESGTQIPALPLNRQWNLGKFRNVSEPQLPHQSRVPPTAPAPPCVTGLKGVMQQKDQSST